MIHLKEVYKQMRDEQNQPQVNMDEVRHNFSQQLSQYKSLGETLYSNGKFREIAEYFNKLVENAEHIFLSEAEKKPFDEITMNRNLKELKSHVNGFNKVAVEAQALQERMSAYYEDISALMERYFQIPDSQAQESPESNPGQMPQQIQQESPETRYHRNRHEDAVQETSVPKKMKEVNEPLKTDSNSMYFALRNKHGMSHDDAVAYIKSTLPQKKKTQPSSINNKK